MNTTAKILSGFLAGMTIGTITGILIAPDKGINTRRKIKEESKHLSSDIAESMSHTLRALTHAYRDRDGGKEKLEKFENARMEKSESRA